MKLLYSTLLRRRQKESAANCANPIAPDRPSSQLRPTVRLSTIVGAIGTLFALGLLSHSAALSPRAEAGLASGAAPSCVTSTRLATGLPDAGQLPGCAFANGGPTSIAASLSNSKSVEKDQSLVVRSGKITGNLRDTLKDVDLPIGVADQVFGIFGPALSTNAKPGKEDRYRILYEREYRGKSPRVVAVDITYNGSKHQVAWFPGTDGKDGKYYSFDGTSVPASRFALPVRYTRISSRFGPRIHPVRHEHHGHSGVDFAAPAGTPVVAAADGTVQFVGSGAGYGNYVAVRHRDGYTTYYGHLSRFAARLRTGMPVKQGDALGEVGSTGTATGPHLHFELRANNRPTDPLAQMGTRFTERLDGNDRRSFGDRVSDIRLRFAQADGAHSLANASEASGSSPSQVS
ncbi:M23 family metallopeptidase [Paraburkholderia sp.]|jgi:murein DD-endopeptidase MepM/ murein hydrolase activator NlpD|uniref:M23 family metallopeptidase n=1 Tax=Paraburkholderia sp. TaxID=1926495 RepID=UPI002F3F3A54